jgi:hypothetical protein
VIASGLGYGKEELRKAADNLTNEVSRMLVAIMRKLQQ